MTSHHLLVILSIVILPVFGRAFSISRGTAVRRCIGPYSRILKSPPHVTQQSTGEDAPPPSSGPSLFLGKPICAYHAITIPSTRMSEGGIPRQDVSVEDLTPILRSLLSTSGMRNGVVHVISRHTTTAITINERESRLAQDVADYFLGICPPDERSSSERRAGGGAVPPQRHPPASGRGRGGRAMSRQRVGRRRSRRAREVEGPGADQRAFTPHIDDAR